MSDKQCTCQENSMQPAHNLTGAVTPLDALRAWSLQEYGEGPQVERIVGHIRRELIEVEAAPNDLSEWVDVITIAADGAMRAGYTPKQIIDGIAANWVKLESRRAKAQPEAKADEITHEVSQWCSCDLEWTNWQPCTAQYFRENNRDKSLMFRSYIQPQVSPKHEAKAGADDACCQDYPNCPNLVCSACEKAQERVTQRGSMFQLWADANGLNTATAPDGRYFDPMTAVAEKAYRAAEFGSALEHPKPADVDEVALIAARHFVPATNPQALAELQCRIIAAIKAETPKPAEGGAVAEQIIEDDIMFGWRLGQQRVCKEDVERLAGRVSRKRSAAHAGSGELVACIDRRHLVLLRQNFTTGNALKHPKDATDGDVMLYAGAPPADALIEDAEDYRWLLAQPHPLDGCVAVSWNIGHDWIPISGDELRTAIRETRRLSGKVEK